MGQSGNTITIERCAEGRLFIPNFCVTITPDELAGGFADNDCIVVRDAKSGGYVTPTASSPIIVERGSHG
jgi:polyhydroxyalkanoate synthesis regulator protein